FRPRARERGEPLTRLAPRRRRRRGLVEARPERANDDLARLRERSQLAEGERLNEQVADERRLRRPRMYRTLRSSSRPRAQQLVLRAAADDVQLVERALGDAREQVDGLRVLEREALEDAADDRAF